VIACRPAPVFIIVLASTVAPRWVGHAVVANVVSDALVLLRLVFVVLWLTCPVVITIVDDDGDDSWNASQNVDGLGHSCWNDCEKKKMEATMKAGEHKTTVFIFFVILVKAWLEEWRTNGNTA
jgi:hypothetical protein